MFAPQTFFFYLPETRNRQSFASDGAILWKHISVCYIYILYYKGPGLPAVVQHASTSWAISLYQDLFPLNGSKSRFARRLRTKEFFI